MGIRVSMPSHARFLRTSAVRSFFSAVNLSFRCVGTLDLATRPGLVREECRKVPPVRPARSTVSSSRRKKLSELSIARAARSEEHTSELQSRQYLVCRLLLGKKKK